MKLPFLTGVLMFSAVIAAQSSSLANLPLPRSGYAAGVLSSILVVAGGSYWDNDVKKWTRQVNAFHPSCNCWTQLPSMPIAVSDAAFMVVGNSLFVLGGMDGVTARRDVQVFDGKSWSLRPELMLPEPRLYASAVTDGTWIYLIGGIEKPGEQASGLGSMWMIDPEHAEAGWVRLPDCYCAMRSNFGLALVHRYLVILGGLATDAKNASNLSDIWTFDLGTRKWRHVGHLPEGKRAVWAAADGEDVLLFGGYTDSFSSEILRFHRGKVELAAFLPEAIAAAAFSKIGARWYVTGGEVGFRRRGEHTWSIELTPPREGK